MKPKCAIDSCETESKHKGMCNRHYDQMRRHGRIGRTIYEPNEIIVYAVAAHDNKIRELFGEYATPR
jgi:Zn-dependent membrane protease YugP